MSEEVITEIIIENKEIEIKKEIENIKEDIKEDITENKETLKTVEIKKEELEFNFEDIEECLKCDVCNSSKTVLFNSFSRCSLLVLFFNSLTFSFPYKILTRLLKILLLLDGKNNFNLHIGHSFKEIKQEPQKVC